MQALRTQRRYHGDLLARPPCGLGDPDRGWADLIVDPAAQLGELADLVARGLLSREEFDELKDRMRG
jgi:Short C-terminal domain